MGANGARYRWLIDQWLTSVADGRQKPLCLACDQEFTRAGQWCQHCAIGQGCTIYEDRPKVCRAWTCQWLVNPALGDHWYPARAKMVVQLVPGKDGDRYEIGVDTGYPNRWREEPWHSELRALSAVGLGAGFRVQAIVGKRVWLVLPDNDVEIGDQVGVVVGINGETKWVQGRDAAHVKEMAAKLDRQLSGINTIAELEGYLLGGEPMTRRVFS
jgi:hypothetical protein